MSQPTTLDYGLYKVHIYYNIRPENIIRGCIHQQHRNVAMYNFYGVTNTRDCKTQVTYNKTYIPGRHMEETMWFTEKSILSRVRYLIVVEYPLLYREPRFNPAFTMDSGRLVVSYVVYMDKNVKPDIYPEVSDIFRRLKSDRVHLLLELDYISVDDNDNITVLSTTNTDKVVDKKDIASLPSISNPVRDWDYMICIIIGWTD